MTGSTRNAYESLRRLQEDFEKDFGDLWALVAAATPVLVMDNLRDRFADVRTDFRVNVRELRADLDLLTDEASQP